MTAPLKIGIVCTCALILFAACQRAPRTGGAQREAGVQAARAELKNANGDIVGEATFTQTPAGVAIQMTANNLPPGMHGVHIHEKGACDAPGFESAGEHFNPGGKHHGDLNPQGPHAGDLGNMVVNAQGVGNLETVNKNVTLWTGDNSLLRAGGTSLMIHAGEDDRKTDPSGNSGARIACGVITEAAHTTS